MRPPPSASLSLSNPRGPCGHLPGSIRSVSRTSLASPSSHGFPTQRDGVAKGSIAKTLTWPCLPKAMLTWGLPRTCLGQIRIKQMESGRCHVCACMCVHMRAVGGASLLGTHPTAASPRHLEASPGMERWWTGTSQSCGHSADIQSVFMVLGRLGKLPEELTCPPIGGEAVPCGRKQGFTV